MADYTKNSFIQRFQHVSFQLSLEDTPKKGFVKAINWRISHRRKYIIALGIIAVILISCFAFLSWKSSPKVNAVIPPGNSTTPSPTPTPTASPKSTGSAPPGTSVIINLSPTIPPKRPTKPPGIIQSSGGMNATVWDEVAENAWTYFQPGFGVDNNTGLPYAGGTGFAAFTDWDLGAYIQAVIDAKEIGIINATGPWGFNNRINLVLTFLENRPLNATTHWPFWFYDATNGQGYQVNSTYASNGVDIIDTGKLLVALNNLRIYNSSLAPIINSIVLGGRSPYASLIPTVKADANSNSIYAYYCWSGFASFWPKQLGSVPNQILNNIINSPTITTYNVTLPDVPITCEPLLMSVFELPHNASLMGLMNQVYEAQVAYATATGTYAAWSEGSSSLISEYVYEWIIAPNGSAWQITNGAQYYLQGVYPIIFYKVALSFLALYNSTYALHMVIALEKALPDPTNGYYDGMDTAGNLDIGQGSDSNGLILDAALYYIQNNPNN